MIPRWLFSDDFEGFLFFHCRFPLSSEILYSGLVLVSYLPKISFYWNFSHLSGYTFQFFEKFETNFTETKLIADTGLATGVANLSEYGKQKCKSMLILSRFSVKFVSQYSTDVENIFYLCGVIAGWRNILMKVFSFPWIEIWKISLRRGRNNIHHLSSHISFLIYSSRCGVLFITQGLFQNLYSISNQLRTFFFE